MPEWLRAPALQAEEPDTLSLYGISLASYDAGRVYFIATKPASGQPPKPLIPYTSSQEPLFRLNPQQWLQCSDHPGEAHVRKIFARACTDPITTLIEISDSLACIEVCGPNSAALLRSGCSVDLDEASFEPGQYADTLLAQMDVRIHRVKDSLCYRLYVDRSLAEHLWQWLQQGVEDFN